MGCTKDGFGVWKGTISTVFRMTLQRSDIQRLARKLAKIHLDDAESDALTVDIQNIMGLIEQLATVNVDGVIPMMTPLSEIQKFRPDQVTDGNERDAIVANAPESRHGFFVVPKVVSAS
jgi:aspartyl-tRNA(Asn)/glutamyl-tRNA(Gln) amidotransferase subunit C